MNITKKKKKGKEEVKKVKLRVHISTLGKNTKVMEVEVEGDNGYLGKVGDQIIEI